MNYKKVEFATFLARPNRFIAQVMLRNTQMLVHVKNTGRCKELLIPGCNVYLETSDSPNRKTKYDLVTVEKNGFLINMDSQAPNHLVREFLEEHANERKIKEIHPEFSYGQSRLDFCLIEEEGMHLLEVKGVTLEENGATFFPDAPTERGVKHLHELIEARKKGIRATVFFVVQMEPAKTFSPNDQTHSAFGETLREAVHQGVEVEVWNCSVTPTEVKIKEPIPLIL